MLLIVAGFLAWQRLDLQSASILPVDTEVYEPTSVRMTQPGAPGDSATPQPVAGDDYIANEVIIEFVPEASTDAIMSYLERVDASELERYRRTTVSGAAVVVRAAINRDVIQNPLPDDPAVAGTSPNYLYETKQNEIRVPVDDPQFAAQWALPAIYLPEAWQMYTAAQPVRLAVLDTGICGNHPDIDPARLVNRRDFVNPANSAAVDRQGHGCAVTGVIAAELNNQLGIAGVTPPDVQILVAQIFQSNGKSSDFAVSNALNWARNQKVQVVNMSLGGFFASDILQKSVQDAANDGMYLIAAAGNEATNRRMYPAAFADVIAVGAVDRNGNETDFSNYGDWIDLWAPGEDILTTNLNGQYSRASGTSFAAPYVSGVVAMHLAAGQSFRFATGDMLDARFKAGDNLPGDTPPAPTAVAQVATVTPSLPVTPAPPVSPPVNENLPAPPFVEGQQYNTLELILMVDHSGSMGGLDFNGDAAYGQSGTDPLGLRFAAPQDAVEWLGRYRQSLTGAEDVQIDVSVFAFGDAVRPLLNWTSLGGANWETLRQDLLQALSEDGYINRYRRSNLGFTDFLLGFTRVRELFQSAPPRDVDDNALRAVIVLTDGAPCEREVGERVGGCQDLVAIDAAGHLQRLEARLDRDFPNTEVFVISIDQEDAYFSQLRGNWQAVVCDDPATCDERRLKQVRTPNELASHMNNVLSYLVNRISPTRVTRNSIDVPPGIFYVEPYQQYMRLNVFKSTDSPLVQEGIEILDPDDNPVLTNVSGLDTPIETYELQLPVPGEWQVNIAPDVMNNLEDVTFVTNSIAANVVDGGSDTLTPALSDATFAVLVQDGGGNTLDRNDDYPLTVEMRLYDISDPNQISQVPVDTFQLPADPNRPDIMSFRGTQRLLTPGVYEVRVRATYQFRDQLKELVTERVIIPRLVVNDIFVDVHGLSLPEVRVGLPVQIRFDIRDKQSGELIAGADDLVMRVALEQNNTPVRDYALLDNASGQSGQIISSYQVNTPGDYEVLAQPGLLDNQGNFVPLTDPSRFNLTVRPIQTVNLAMEMIPAESPIESQRTSLVPFFPPVPVELNITLRNEQGERLNLDMAALTNQKEVVPDVVVMDTAGNELQNLTNEVTRISPGFYRVTLRDLQPGTYTFVARSQTDNNDLTADYQWGAAEAMQTQERYWNWRIFAVIGAGVALPILVLIGLFFLGAYRRQRGENPLQGTLWIYKTEGGANSQVPLGGVVLTDKKVYKVSLSGRELGAGAYIENIQVSTRKNRIASQEGSLYVEEVKLQQNRATVILREGARITSDKKVLLAKADNWLLYIENKVRTEGRSESLLSAQMERIDKRTSTNN